jgi:hypothetical protein
MIKKMGRRIKAHRSSEPSSASFGIISKRVNAESKAKKIK